MEKKNNYAVLGEKQLEKSRIEIEAEIPAESVTEYRKKALKNLSAKAELPGFRKGHVPENVLIKNLGEMAITEEAAEEAINDVVPLILAEKKINFITQPEISILSIAPGNPLKFKITVAYLPEVALPDYKRIASDKNKKSEPAQEITDKELEESIQQIRKISAKQLGLEESKLEINDEFVKKLGNFENVAAFRTKLRKDMLEEKNVRAREKKRLEIAEGILDKTEMELPDALVEYELDRMQGQFEGDLSNMGMKLDDYLSKVNKKMEDIKKEWRPDAEKRAKLELIIYKIAAAEKIAPSEEEVKKETDHIMEHYKDLDRDTAARYIERTLINQKVFEFLENQK